MSHQLISHSSDLTQLRAEGYDIEVRAGHLLLKSVPYVDADLMVRRGILVSPLGDVSGDRTSQPNDHTAHFIGGHPHNADGSILQAIQHSSKRQELAKGIVADHMFSAKPKPSGKYRDYHHKMTTYASHISTQARVIDQSATAQTCAVIETTEAESPFHYLDTASTRAGISTITAKLEGQKIAIVGVGGTGSYVLDLVAKTPVDQIHLYDGDAFANHNAFRTPGAASLDELRGHPTKATYLRDRYSKMHRWVFAHEYFLDEDNLNELETMNFVFLCMDRGGDKRYLVEWLEACDKPFVDVGVGVEVSGDSLRGQVRVTMSTPNKHDHLKQRVSFTENLAENEYSSNIQIADLNALNAALAVIKWKKLCGFYQDLDHEHHCLYTINGNCMNNEDRT
jgi:molybdopterin/thiamine biosynthesis adenylyltransferase